MSNLTNQGQQYALELAFAGRDKLPRLYLGLTNESLVKASGLDDVLVSETLGSIDAPGAATGALAGLGAGNLSNGDYKYKVTFVTPDGETDGGTVSNTVTVSSFSSNGQIALSSIPTGPSHVTARKLYRTVANGSVYKLLDTIPDNTTTTYNDNIADGSLGATLAIVNSTGQKTPPVAAVTSALAGAGAGNLSAGLYKYKVTFISASGETESGPASAGTTVVTPGTNGKIALSNIPIGTIGVTQRKVYRTVAGGLVYKLVTTIADNSTTTFTDNVADGSLGGNEPDENTTAPNGYKRILVNQDNIDFPTSAIDAGDWQLTSKEFEWESINLDIGPADTVFLTDSPSGSPVDGLLLAFWDLSSGHTLTDLETLGFVAFIKNK